MIDKIIKKIENIFNKFKNRKIKNTDFSIISNNCWGNFVYQHYNLEYKTPFVGLFVFAPDYIIMLKDLKYYLDKKLVFIKSAESKYYNELIEFNVIDKYPIGALDDIEIHFLHYKDEEEAKTKWERRLKRINYNKLLIKFCDRDNCTEELLKEFEKLNYKNKICFTSKKYNYKSTVFLKACEGLKMVDDEFENSRKEINIDKLIKNV